MSKIRIINATRKDRWTWLDALKVAFPDLGDRERNIISHIIGMHYGNDYSLVRWIWSQDYLQIASEQGVGPKFEKRIKEAVERFRREYPETQDDGPRCPHCGQRFMVGG